MDTRFASSQPAPHEGYAPVGSATLYYREVGRGQPILVLHGGPDFDHSYLLPGLDRLSDSFRLIYYDQRGRGKSGEGVQAEEVSLQSDVEDLECLRRHLQLGSVAVLGHSWGGVLALEYAIRYPSHVSHLILLNTGPASHGDYMRLRQDRRQRAAADVDELRARSSDAKYRAGDPDAVADYYRVHFRTALKRPEHLELVITRLRSSFTKAGILKARAIEERLLNETWWSSEYDLLPRLERLDLPALVLHGEDDLIPAVCAAHIAQAIPGARLVLLRECGHFSFLERPEEVRKEIVGFLGGRASEDGNPVARCRPENIASQNTLQKAGFAPCGHILTGLVPPQGPVEQEP